MVQKDASGTEALFKRLVSSVLPWAAKEKVSTDAQLKERMTKEVSKGPIVFDAPPTSQSILANRMKQMRLPDEFRQRLAAKRSKE